MSKLLLASLFWFPATADVASPLTNAAAAAMAPAFDEKALKALDAWLRLYHGGKMDFRSPENISKDSIAAKFGLTGKNGLGTPTWAGDLDTILEAVAKLDTAEAAAALLEVAAIGMDKASYTVEMAPYDVRAAGERWIVRLGSSAAKDELAKAARGELKVDKARAMPMQVAALRALMLLKDGTSRKAMEQALGSPHEMVRIAAAEALAVVGDDESAKVLIGMVEREPNDAVLVSAAQTLRSLYARYLPKSNVFNPSPDKPKDDKGDKPAEGEKKDTPAAAPDAPAAPVSVPPLPDSVRIAVRAVIGALGRSTWRADMALVRFLDDFRSIDAIPALVAVLERFQAHPEEVKSGKLSGLLMYQSHELLVSMTGAVFPATAPDKWRAFWDTERDKLSVGQKKPASAAGSGTVASGFCGIPVEGTRVVFVLDLSGSMQWNMDSQDKDGKKTLTKRVDFAKRELIRAMDQISPNAQFNLVTFNGNPKCEEWKKELVPANERNREAFKKYVEGLRADGGTNLWSGLEAALKLKSLVLGNRYTTNIDELFILSDGAPTVGEVQDPIEILKLVQACNRFANVRINTIFISSATPPEAMQAQPKMAISPQELMRRMAEQNGGKFKEL